MQTDTLFKRWLSGWLVLGLFVASVAAAETVPAPRIDVQGTGDYIVSYQACVQCSGHGIQEYQEPTGVWDYVGTGEISFANRAPGTYRYRIVYFLYIGLGGYRPAYGPEGFVVVDENGQADLLNRPALPDQLAANYIVSSGHIDGDGNLDLLIRRSAGSSENEDGMIGDVLLKQTSPGQLEASLPDQWQLAVASSWLPASVEVRKRDVNIDGYVDLVLRGLDQTEGFTQLDNQILFAPGDSYLGQEPQLRAIDADLVQFSTDIDRHLIDPDYYPENVPLNYGVVVYYTLDCGWMAYNGYYDGFSPWSCSIEPWYIYVVYRDLSMFDPAAMQIARSDYAMIHGYETTDQGMENIATTIAGALGIGIGGWDINELLGETAAVTTDADRRGMELFAVLAAISDAAEDNDDVDEPIQDAERVLIKGRRVLGQGPFHTALEFRGSTVSAYDSDSRALFDGNLVSEINWPRDHPSLTMRMGFVEGPGSPLIYWSSLLFANSRYPDDLPYDLFPSLGQAGYNSNSFTSGIVNATAGQPSIQLDSFVGGERPVPASAFN